jgi:hypothetical protein
MLNHNLLLKTTNGNDGFMPVTATIEVLVLDARRFTYRQTYSFNMAALVKFMALNGPVVAERDANGDFDLVLTINPELL